MHRGGVDKVWAAPPETMPKCCCWAVVAHYKQYDKLSLWALLDEVEIKKSYDIRHFMGAVVSCCFVFFMVDMLVWNKTHVQLPCDGLMSNNSSHVLLVSPVNLIAVVDVLEGCKLCSHNKSESSFITQENASLYSLSRHICNELFSFLTARWRRGSSAVLFLIV